MANTDKFMYMGSPGTATTLSAPGYTVGNTSINVGSTTNWPTGSGLCFSIYETEVVGSGAVMVDGTYNEYYGDVASGTSVNNVTHVSGSGTNRNYSAGALTVVTLLFSSGRENRLVEGILVHADQDGTLKAGAVDNAAVLANSVVSTAKIADASVTPAKWANPYKFRAVPASDQTGLSGTTWITVTFGTESYDSNSNFASSTYTAPVTGYYQFNANLRTTVTAGLYTGVGVRLYKNGTTAIGSPEVFDNNWSADFLFASYNDCIPLTVGDTVVMQGILQLTGGTGGFSTASSFSGFLVSQT